MLTLSATVSECFHFLLLKEETIAAPHAAISSSMNPASWLNIATLRMHATPWYKYSDWCMYIYTAW